MHKIEQSSIDCEMAIRRLAAEINFERDLSKFREAILWGLFESINILTEAIDRRELNECEVLQEIRKGILLKDVK